MRGNFNPLFLPFGWSGVWSQEGLFKDCFKTANECLLLIQPANSKTIYLANPSALTLQTLQSKNDPPSEFF